jgi:glutamate-ammonia-ligase adenylyltransferase
VSAAAQCETLRAAYAFLRRTENRLQMEGERQTTGCPPMRAAAPAWRARWASPATMRWPTSTPRSTTQRERIRSAFAALFAEDGVHALLDLFQRSVRPVSPSRHAQPTSSSSPRTSRAPSMPSRSASGDEQPRSIHPRHRLAPLLLRLCWSIARAGRSPRALFAASEYLSGYLAHHPRADRADLQRPNVLVLSREELRTALADIRRDLAAEGPGDETERELDALRRFHNRELINIGLLDLAEKITVDEADAGLTDLADVCVEGALALARADLVRRDVTPAAGELPGRRAMGKLASRELTYGSDLDVIFLYDVESTDDAAQLAAQGILRATGAEAPLGAANAHQRRHLLPDRRAAAAVGQPGHAGVLAGELRAVPRRQCPGVGTAGLLRAAADRGGGRLADAFVAQRARHLCNRWPPTSAPRSTASGCAWRTELAHETSQRRDFKTGRGGMLDVESVVQFLQLRHARAHPELLDVDRTSAHLERLADSVCWPPDDAAALQRGWAFSATPVEPLRIVENRSISDLDEERGDLEGLARRLGYESPQRPGGARRALLEDYRRHTADIRAVYEKVLGVGA